MASRDGPYSCGEVAERRSGVDTGGGLLRGTGSAVDVCAGPAATRILVVSVSSSDEDDEEEQGKVPTGSLGNICRGSRTTADDIWAAVVLMLFLMLIDLYKYRLKIPLFLAVFFFFFSAFCVKASFWENRTTQPNETISIRSSLKPPSAD